MPYKYRAIVHSPHSRSAGILQGTVDWASPSPVVRTTHPACFCVVAGRKYTVQESNPAHTFRGGKTVGSAPVPEDGFEEVNVIGVMTQSYAEKVGLNVTLPAEYRRIVVIKIICLVYRIYNILPRTGAQISYIKITNLSLLIYCLFRNAVNNAGYMHVASNVSLVTW